MINQKFDRCVKNGRTLLCVGPVSQNCVDSTIEIANEYEVPIVLIASRRQVDSEEFGGGYVNNWTTKAFANYVINRDKKGKVFLARDHGGPWQQPVEEANQLSLRQAMDSAKRSFDADIEAGFQILHIDPSIDIHGVPDLDETLDRLFELYEHCYSLSQSRRQPIQFEIGTEEQSGSTNSVEELEYILAETQKFCVGSGCRFPLFVVVQTGTMVMETRNVGSFDSPVRIYDELPPEIQVPKVAEVCRRFGVSIKAHNTDYLSDDSLRWYPRLGIHAANVAPEFGVCETRAILWIFKEHGLSCQSDRFLELAFESRKWEKWMLSGTHASDYQRSEIAGHYVFSTPAFQEIMAEAKQRLSNSGVDLDGFLRLRIKDQIVRYLSHFRMINQR